MAEEILSAPTFPDDKFKLGKKWFWVGMIVGLFSVLAGLTFGIALLSEKEHRREGVWIIIFSLICYALKTLVFFPWLISSGFLPQYGVTKLK